VYLIPYVVYTASAITFGVALSTYLTNGTVNWYETATDTSSVALKNKGTNGDTVLSKSLSIDITDSNLHNGHMNYTIPANTVIVDNASCLVITTEYGLTY